VEVECGGFATVSQGIYGGYWVAVKVVCVYVTSDLDTILSVSILPISLHISEQADHRGFVKRALLGNTSNTPTYYHSVG